MATERTAMHPLGGAVHLDDVDEQYMHPLIGAVDSTIEAAAGGTGVVHAIAGKGGIAGEGGIAGKHGGIAG